MRANSRLGFALCLGVLIGMSCSFTFRDDLVYSCTTESDCGGGGFVCLAGACCKATGEEVCGDGLDNDCNGLIDGDGNRTTEVCNGQDDDCDGLTDEGYDLQINPAHCGTCGKLCEPTERCSAGTCQRRAETDCANGVDDDQNGSTDCADQGCNLISCGLECLCRSGVKSELRCDDGVDSDGDGATDCADSDCDTRFCGEGCACINGAPKETNCSDSLDNDQDGGADCADLACEAQLCLSGTTQRCLGTACLCNGGAVVPEDSTLCGDGLDNDCDNQIDCREAACDAQSCSPDGGADCLCVGIVKTERTCSNGRDDDGDLAQDCADTDCAGASCQADGGLAPDGGAACLCTGNTSTEAHCGDRTDNDGDALTDCADFMDCPQGRACTRNNGQPGNCQANRGCN